MSQLVGRTIRMAMILISLVGLLPTVASAFSVTADSEENRVYLIIWHRDVNFPLEGISIQITSSPAELSPVFAVYTPATIPPDSGRVGGLEFDVVFGAVLGNLALLHEATGDREQALQCHRDSIESFRRRLQPQARRLVP